MAKGIYTDVRQDELGNTSIEPTRRPAQDSEAPANAGASALMPSPFEGKGYLLEEEDDAKVFRAIDDEVKAQEPLAKNREAKRKWRAAVRAGEQFATLEKDEDRNTWKYCEPPGEGKPNPVPNKADDLCRKIVSQIIVDLPQPDPKPATDSEQDRGAADLAKRFLKVDGDESGTNDAELFRDILDSSQTDASEFAHVWVDMKGGGWRPQQIKAHPQAKDPANPLVAQDPVTGQELPTADYVLRYVTQDGQFTENPAEAAQQWLPKIMRDVLGPPHVRTVPEQADVANAEGVILIQVGPISSLKRRVPAIAGWDDAQLAKLVDWKPRRPKSLVPPALRNRFKEQEKKDGMAVDDNALVFWYTKYCSPGPDYSDGAQILVSGVDGGLVLAKATLRHDVETDDGVHVLLRDVPVSQNKALHDSDSRDPFGKAPIDLYGAANEGLANLYGATMEDTTKRINPLWFIPSTSPVQEWQMRARGGPAIPVYSKDDMPFAEEPADLASFLPQIIEKIETGMENAAGLGNTAQVLDSPNSKSGIAKQIEVSQAKVFLSPSSQNFFAFVKRYWRLKLEAAQAFLTIPQEVEYVGIDQAYKQRWFKGADFAGVKDVAVMAGTGTLMAPAEKQQYLSFAQQAAWIDPDEASEAGRSSIADDLGLQTSPAEDAIKREIAQWMQGPPKPEMDPATGQPAMDPMTGAPKPTWAQQSAAYEQEQQRIAQTPVAEGQPPMQPSVPAPWSPFMVRPTDEDPSVAKRQYKILRDFCYTSDYAKQPPEWRAVFDQRVAQAQFAAGIQTVRQQAEAAAQQQQMMAQEQDKDREFKRGEGEANRAAKAQQPMGVAA